MTAYVETRVTHHSNGLTFKLSYLRSKGLKPGFTACLIIK